MEIEEVNRVLKILESKDVNDFKTLPKWSEEQRAEFNEITTNAETDRILKTKDKERIKIYAEHLKKYHCRFSFYKSEFRLQAQERILTYFENQVAELGLIY